MAVSGNIAKPGIVSMLLLYGADPNMRDIVFGTPLRAAAGVYSDNIAATELLIDTGANVHHQTNFVATALHRAAQAGNVKIYAAADREGSRR